MRPFFVREARADAAGRRDRRTVRSGGPRSIAGGIAVPPCLADAAAEKNRAAASLANSSQKRPNRADFSLLYDGIYSILSS